MSNLLAAVRAREAPVSNVRTEVTGVLGEAPARFTTVQLVVTADGADAETLDRLVEIAERGCITMNTLRGKLDVQVRTAAPAR
jgi:putative redox protein